ncbi:MAG: energy transducer TonB [Terracidiphilus sp.]
MRTLWFAALFVGFGVSISGGQQPSSSTPPKPDTQSPRVKVYTVGPDVTAPELLPPNLAPIPSGKCKKKMDGKVVLSVLVDETGQPHNIIFLRPLSKDLDKLALKLVAADRFKPGTHDGAPVVVGLSVDVDFLACIDEITDDAGKKASWLRLRSQPVQKLGTLPEPPEEAVLSSDTISLNGIDNNTPHTAKVGGSVTAPVILISANPQYTPEAKNARINGVCVVTLIVDRQGMPQNIQITKSLDPGLDQNAIDAVANFRFKPSMRNGEPVAVMVSIEINFRLY